jgi:hypothetical protein
MKKILPCHLPLQPSQISSNLKLQATTTSPTQKPYIWSPCENDTKEDLPPVYPIHPVHWNKAVPSTNTLPASTDEPALSTADIRQIHFICTGNFIAKDEVPSDLFAIHMAQSKRQFNGPSCPDPPSSSTLEDGSDVFRISAISSEKMTEAKIALGPRLLRRLLRKISTWPKWQAAEWKQLSSMHLARSENFVAYHQVPCRCACIGHTSAKKTVY